METRANFVLIGVFAVAGFAGIIGFLLWFARIELDRQFAYYDIAFTSVSGLSQASDVRFSGFPVGRVVDLRLSPVLDGTISVRVEVDAETPVRTDSLATVESQGVTGVSYVGISPGTPQAPLLTAEGTDNVPNITAGRSTFQQLSEDAPEILSETLGVAQELRQILGGENKIRVESILINIESASRDFSQALQDFSAVSGSVTAFAQEIGRFNTTLDQMTGDLSGVMATATTTLTSISGLADEAGATLTLGADAIRAVQDTLASADSYVAEDLAGATVAIQVTLAELRREMASLGQDSRGLIGRFALTGDAATARLAEVETTLAATNGLIARLDTAVGTIDGAASRFDDLMANDAEPLLADIREAVAQASGAITTVSDTVVTEFPQLFVDIRHAADTASRVFGEVGADLTSASGRIEALSGSAEIALDSVATTFSRANDTLTAVNSALDTGGRALSAAERAFDGADRVINEDLTQTAADLRTTLATLNTLVAGVAGDVPQISEDLRAASRSADAAFADFRQVMAVSGASVREFATSALPQYTRLALETRSLIANLDGLVNRIERDPARFLLEPGAPEFRR